MNTILTLTDQDFVPNAPVGDRDSYWHRFAARAVVLDDDGNVAIMHASNDGYYKLPGGGIDEGEEILDALDREMMEEIGSKITVTGEVGIVEEHRDFVPMNQTSYAYLAKLNGEKGTSQLTAKEIKAGFKVVWTDINTAIDLVQSGSDPADIQGSAFMCRRDAEILKAAKKLII